MRVRTIKSSPNLQDPSEQLTEWESGSTAGLLKVFWYLKGHSLIPCWKFSRLKDLRWWWFVDGWRRKNVFSTNIPQQFRTCLLPNPIQTNPNASNASLSDTYASPLVEMWYGLGEGHPIYWLGKHMIFHFLPGTIYRWLYRDCSPYLRSYLGSYESCWPNDCKLQRIL